MFGRAQTHILLATLLGQVLACAPVRQVSGELKSTNSVAEYTSLNCRTEMDSKRNLRMFRGPDMFGMIAVNPSNGKVVEAYMYDYSKYVLWKDGAPILSTNLATVFPRLSDMIRYLDQWGSDASKAAIAKHVRIVPGQVQGSFFPQVRIGPDFSDDSWSMSGNLMFSELDEGNPLVIPETADGMIWRQVSFQLDGQEKISSQKLNNGHVMDVIWMDGGAKATLKCDQPEPFDPESIAEKIQVADQPGIQVDATDKLSVEFSGALFKAIASINKDEEHTQVWLEAKLAPWCRDIVSSLEPDSETARSLMQVSKADVVASFINDNIRRQLWAELRQWELESTLSDFDATLERAVGFVCADPLFAKVGRK